MSSTCAEHCVQCFDPPRMTALLFGIRITVIVISGPQATWTINLVVEQCVSQRGD